MTALRRSPGGQRILWILHGRHGLAIRSLRENGKMLKLDGGKPLHLEYGYCSTVHAAQGKTCDRVLIEADTKSLTSARDNYYVAISRARHEVKIYTNDKDKLPEAMNRLNDKQSALEIYQKSSDKPKNIEKTMDYN